MAFVFPKPEFPTSLLRWPSAVPQEGEQRGPRPAEGRRSPRKRLLLRLRRHDVKPGGRSRGGRGGCRTT